MSNQLILISDASLRDGNHALNHTITLSQIKRYAQQADDAGIDIIEIGHGNGLGASSLQLGFSSVSDRKMLMTARDEIKKAKLGIHIIPGYGKLNDLKTAVEIGVDVFRIASHCTEADTTERYIQYVRAQNKEVVGVLMMSHMAAPELLLAEAKKLVRYGASTIVLMDSAGWYLPDDVMTRVGALVSNLSVPIGFHGHNNLGFAVANSLVAIQSGATLIDATIKGFGAGAGNTILEVLVAVLIRSGYKTNVNFAKILKLAENAEAFLVSTIPTISSDNILSGLHGVFSGFATPVRNAAKKYTVSLEKIYRELGKRKVVAGQEDIIIDVCETLSQEYER